jgi:hypothetical protein
MHESRDAAQTARYLEIQFSDESEARRAVEFLLDERPSIRFEMPTPSTLTMHRKEFEQFEPKLKEMSIRYEASFAPAIGESGSLEALRHLRGLRPSSPLSTSDGLESALRRSREKLAQLKKK